MAERCHRPYRASTKIAAAVAMSNTS